MTNEAQEFFNKAARDSELSHQISAIYQNATRMTASALAELAQKSGSSLTAEDFLSSEAELSEDQLEGIAGGFSVGLHRRVLQPDGTYKTVLVVHNS